jgi:hypothetical protein
MELKNLTVKFGLLNLLFVVAFLDRDLVQGHGRLLEPPNRSSLWRLPEFAKYNPTPNYDDNQLYCGGFAVQYQKNGGNCGPCGGSPPYTIYAYIP